MAERTAEKGRRWWVLRQHKDAQVVESDKRPDTKVEKGERVKSVQGPFASKDAATAAMNGERAAKRAEARKGK